jgi:D-amino-acid dehydrogenase
MPYQPFACVSTARNAADVIVLGAGVVGVSTAYYLAKRGKSVIVIDQLPGPALDTSFANGGQISVSHAEPWAAPDAPFKVLKWLAREDSPLLFRPKLDPWQWWWLMAWLVECLPSRTERNTIELLKLATLSRGKVKEIRAAEALRYDHKTLGILAFHRSQKSFDEAAPIAELMRKYGCDRRIVDRAEICRIEPALEPNATGIAGGAFTAEDESGDAHQFTTELAKVCARLGVRFLYNHEIVKLKGGQGRLDGVELRNLATAGYTELSAEHYVMALGSFSAPLLRPLGVRLNLYPAKGYSMTLPVAGGNGAPQVSLSDEDHKIVYTRLGERLRVAGTAELNGYGRALNLVRAEALRTRTRELFPAAGRYEEASFWAGLRPTTPSGAPYLGRSQIANLSLNTGHGTLGWTMGPGSGFLLAEAIADGRLKGRLIDEISG